jgi:hypothetical protein
MTGPSEAKPYVSENGVLVMPEDCDPKYRWWTKDGQSVMETMKELKVSKTVWARYTEDPYPEELQKENYPLL